MPRIAAMTRCSFTVTSRAAILCLLLALGVAPAPAFSEEPIDVDRLLRRAAAAAPPEIRALLEQALAVPRGGSGDSWASFAWQFERGSEPEFATRLMRRALHEGVPRIEPEEERPQNDWRSNRSRAEADFMVRLHEIDRAGDRAAGARVATSWYLQLGAPVTARMLDPWPPSPVIRAVLEDDFGRITDKDGASVLNRWDEGEVTALLRSAGAAASALTDACYMDHGTSTRGLDSLLKLGVDSIPVLLHEARRAADGVPPSRIDRCVKAITVLGLIGDRSATEALMACMLSNDGWIRAAAATALGDLGDPKAAIALARQLAYAGDPFRSRESWDYPGTTETTVKPEDWLGVEYYVIDAAAADALIAMGSSGSVGWLLRNDLDPKRRNLRIRVLQDALDTIHRHLPDAPTADYNPDDGLPQRHAAFERLEAWWRANRGRPDRLKKRFDERDPGWLEQARGLARRLGEPKVLELMIAKDSCELLGHVITPVLVEALTGTKSASHKNELAQALARVRDPRAVLPLMGLLKERAGFVRAAALGALGTYLGLGAYVALGAQAEPRWQDILAAVVERLEDPDCGVQVAAMQALVAAPPSDLVRAAIAKHDEAVHAARCGDDANYVMALTVVRLAQEGEAHWPKVRDGLRSKDRVERRTWWDLVRLALDLYEHDYDPIADPASPDWRSIDEAKVLHTLRTRLGGK